jgi:hypothetical protein
MQNSNKPIYVLQLKKNVFYLKWHLLLLKKTEILLTFFGSKKSEMQMKFYKNRSSLYFFEYYINV